jgi:antitoxin (DNA-binding transcriptional repressor) of toxin-antitoxin stability system
MMMTTILIDVQDAQHQLGELLDQAAAGTEIILTEDHQPRARLVPITVTNGAATAAQPPLRQRIPGLHPGGMTPSPDFDDPLPDEFWLGTP